MSYRKLDISRIRSKAADIKESVAILSQYAARSDQDFLTNLEAVRAARYTLIVALEAATNIGNHLCSRILNKAPASYAETFRFLFEGKIISEKLANNLSKIAGLRNILVHRYAEIDDRKILKFFRENLNDLEDFLMELNNYLQKPEIEGGK